MHSMQAYQADMVAGCSQLATATAAQMTKATVARIWHIDQTRTLHMPDVCKGTIQGDCAWPGDVDEKPLLQIQRSAHALAQWPAVIL